MKAVVVQAGVLVWEDRPTPVLGPEEVLVRVAAAGVNGADLMQRAGHYPPPPGVPIDQPGLELAGTVEAVGARAVAFSPGDTVMALVTGAAQAELVAVPERLALPVPEGLSLTEAGAFPEVFCTAHDALFAQAALSAGERLLVTGAGGGVGTAAVQLAVAAGAEVVASARHSAVHGRLAALGARPAPPEEAVRLGPFDVVLELVGGPSLPAALAATGPWARMVVIGTGGGRTAQVDLGLLMHRRATLRGSTLRSRPLEERALLVQRVGRLCLPLVAGGRLRPPVARTFAAEDAQQAYDYFAAGGKFGKIVLAMPGGTQGT